RMTDVAERAGCVRATLYNHFPSRDRLLEALCSEYLKGYLEIHARVRQWTRPDHTIFEVLRETVTEELRWRVANADLREALDAARLSRLAFYVEGDRQIDQAMLAWFGAIYRASCGMGLLRPGIDLQFAERAVYAMIDSVVGEFPVDTSAADLRKAAGQVSRLSWNALYVGDAEDAPPFATIASLLTPSVPPG
ncbi:MAG: TetR/AcrR family transcriptional regulator, partial [Solirubrobacteraceae bacterium]